MSDFIKLDREPGAADRFREAASERARRKAESFERCDTDGYVSQWASGVMEQAYSLLQRIADDGGVASFPCAREKATGDLVPAKWIETRYGGKFAVFAKDDTDMRGQVQHWTTGGKVSLGKHGLELVFVELPVAGVKSVGGNALSVRYVPVPEKPFDADAKVERVSSRTTG